jgi:hypothetical protein
VPLDLGLSDDGPDLGALRRLLASCTVLGAELDPEYRVLGLTVEPLDADPEVDDRRQVVLHPVGEFAASLRRADRTVLTFDVEHLPDVVARFEGAVPQGDPLPSTRPARDAWGSRPSLQGASAAPDGRTHHLRLHLEHGDLVLDLHVTFDDYDVRDPSGAPIEP